MNEDLKIILPVLFALYFGVCFLWRSFVVWRHTGTNPYVLNKSNGVYGSMAGMYGLTLFLVIFDIAVYSYFSKAYGYLVPISFIQIPFLRFTGVLLLVASFFWTYIAQGEMRESWRIGIDHEAQTPLVRKGLFLWSRNPIFVGMIGALFGLFLTTPNLVSLLALVLGVVLIRIQVRLEEEYLTRAHGSSYENYCKKVRRWL